MDCEELKQRTFCNTMEDDSYAKCSNDANSWTDTKLVPQFDGERKTSAVINSVCEDKSEEALQNVSQRMSFVISDKENKDSAHLYSAVEKREKGMIKLLLDGGADMTTRNRSGKSPLEFARDGGNDEIIKMLTYRKVSVPPDSSCLFWASTLAYLIPVRYDDNSFQTRFERLFGNVSPVQTVGKIQGIIQEYNTTSNYAYLRNDKTLKFLVICKFRNKVFEEMSSYQEEFAKFVTLNDILQSKNENFVTGGTFREEFCGEFSVEMDQCGIDINVFKPETFNEASIKLIYSELAKVSDQDKVKKFILTAYLKGMRDPKSWCGNNEIRAISRMLHCNVHVFSDGMQHYIKDENSSDKIQLFHDGEMRYNFGLVRAPVLIEAIKCNKEEEAEVYLSLGIDDVDYESSDGWTALHYAAQQGYTKVIELLLSQGASASVKNSLHQTPLDVAKMHDKQCAANALIKKSEASVGREQSEAAVCDQQSEVGGSVEDVIAGQIPPVKQRTNENKTMSDQANENQSATYKRTGEGGLGGQIYEIELSMLFLLQGITKKEAGEIVSFYLATNLNEAEDFDDVVFYHKYKDENGSIKSKIIFLQAKHKENPNTAKEKVTFEKLLSDSGKKGDFTLRNYFRSYLDVKKSFSVKEQGHPIFEGNFEDLDCEFIIYTNASSILSKDARIIAEAEVDSTKKVDEYYIKEIDGYKVKVVRLKKESFLYLEGSSQSRHYYELVFDGDRKGKITNVLQTSFASKKFKGETGKKFLNDNKGVPDLPSEKEIGEFLSRLKIFVEQPGENELSTILKQKIQSVYQVEENDANSIFSDVRNKVEKWWKEENNFLTEDNTYFKDSVKISIFFDVKKPVGFFIGREEELNELNRKLQLNSGKIMVISQNTDVSGTGGIGKTELVAEYVSTYSQHYDNVLWIKAESYRTLVDSFCRLAQDKLKIKTQSLGEEEVDIKPIVDEVYKYFIKRKSLFIFDDAQPDGSRNDDDAGIKKFLPSLTAENNSCFIITSRYQEWDDAEVLPLDVFTEEIALEFIRRSLDIEHGSKDGEVRQLVDTLKCFPLALQQAVTYIKEENKKLQNLGEEFLIEDYLEKYEREQNKVGMRLGLNIFDDNIYSKVTFISWKITLEKIKEVDYAREALDILDVIAYFAPKADSTILFFKDVIHKRETDSSLQLLRQYSSVISQHGEAEKHSLIEKVISTCPEGNKDTEVLRRTIKMLERPTEDETSSCSLCASRDVRGGVHYDNYDDLVKMYPGFPALRDKLIVRVDDKGRPVIFYATDPSESD